LRAAKIKKIAKLKKREKRNKEEEEEEDRTPLSFLSPSPPSTFSLCDSRHVPRGAARHKVFHHKAAHIHLLGAQEILSERERERVCVCVREGGGTERLREGSRERGQRLLTFFLVFFLFSNCNSLQCHALPSFVLQSLTIHGAIQGPAG
jgi:hypothetical protein